MTWENVPDAFSTRLRVAVIGLLMAGEQDFVTLRRLTGASDGNLSSQLEKLVDAGFILRRRSFAGNKTRTTYLLTDVARTSYRAYVTLLVCSILDKSNAS